MIFNTLKHILGLKFHQGNRYTGNRHTNRHTTRLPYTLVCACAPMHNDDCLAVYWARLSVTIQEVVG